MSNPKLTKVTKQFLVSSPQHRFINNSTSPFLLLVGGFGSGKTQAGILRLLKLKWQVGESNVAYYMPNYDLVKMVAIPRMLELLSLMKIRPTVNKSDHTISIHGRGIIYFRSYNNPDSIIGYGTAHAIADELDILNITKATDIWKRIVARNRIKIQGRNTIAVPTTPEGHRFCYQRWVKNPTEKHEVIRCSTYENERNLSPDYIGNLKTEIPAHLLPAYLDGQFIPMTTGRVYSTFDRMTNATDAVIQSGETLHIGMDFNVYNMSAVVHVIRGDCVFVVDEITKGIDTPDIIRSINRRYPNHPINIYPDASGANNDTRSAGKTDIFLLRQAGFRVLVKKTNPFVKDRVLSLGAMIENGEYKNRYFVNIEKCSELVECFEQQVYSNGAPDKSMGYDHLLDCTGYFINYAFPVTKVNYDEQSNRPVIV